MKRLGGRRPQEIHEIDAFFLVNVKLDTLSRRLDKMGMQDGSSSSTANCEICNGKHEMIECQVGSLFANSEQV